MGKQVGGGFSVCLSCNQTYVFILILCYPHLAEMFTSDISMKDKLGSCLYKLLLIYLLKIYFLNGLTCNFNIHCFKSCEFHRCGTNKGFSYLVVFLLLIEVQQIFLESVASSSVRSVCYFFTC